MPGIAEGIDALTAKDAGFRKVLAINGPLQFTLKPGGFAGLLRIILGQQVSVLAAEAIWRKVKATIRPLTPQTVAAANMETLRGCGLSGQKAAYAKALAEKILTGQLDFKKLRRADDEDAIAAMTACHGIGRWTAENYLLFCEGRADIFPAKDLAIMIGLEWLKKMPARPTPIEAYSYAARWRPYRSAATLLLWHHYIAQVKRKRAA
jgi:DNA-3-methyladenine glycosylase II